MRRRQQGLLSQAGSFATPLVLNAGDGAPLAWRRGGGSPMLRTHGQSCRCQIMRCRRQQ